MSSYTAYNSNSSNTTSTMTYRLKHAIKNSLSTNLRCPPQQYHNYSTAWSTKYIVILPSSSWLQFIVTRTVKYMQIDKCNISNWQSTAAQCYSTNSMYKASHTYHHSSLIIVSRKASRQYCYSTAYYNHYHRHHHRTNWHTTITI